MRQGAFFRKKLCDGVDTERKILRGILEQLIMYTFGKFSYRVYFWGFLMRQGTGCGDFFHTPASFP